MLHYLGKDNKLDDVEQMPFHTQYSDLTCK